MMEDVEFTILTLNLLRSCGFLIKSQTLFKLEPDFKKKKYWGPGTSINTMRGKMLDIVNNN